MIVQSGVARIRSLALVCLAFVCVLVDGCRPRTYSGPRIRRGHVERKLTSEPSVRVALARRVKKTRLNCATSCEVWSGPPGKLLFEAVNLELEVSAGPGGFTVNGKSVQGEWLALRPRQGVPVRIDGRPYPGQAHLTREGDGFTVLNVVSAERYIGGVVAKEMKPSWPKEALKAQAVAARSYVVHEIRLSRKKAFDVVATSRSQRYSGDALDARVTRAVESTRGLVLARNGRVVPGFYHSTCGGHTAGAADVFEMQHLAFMHGVPCSYCRHSPFASWSIEIGADELCRALDRPGRPVKKVTAMQILGRREDGRFASVRVFTGKEQFDVKALHFRYALGTYRLKSNRFSVETSSKGFLMRGRGFGHGVGMCQYGARGMADLNASYEQILAKYYPDTELARLYD